MGFFSDLGRALSGGGGNNNGGGAGSGQAANQPSYSPFSIQGLTSSDPANVARNQAAVVRINAAEAAAEARGGGNRGRDRPAAAAAPAAPAVGPPSAPVAPPPTLTPPGAPLPVVPGEAPTSAVEAAAIESTQGGRQSTILTSALGLLADQEAQGLLRPRRSLMSGGMIK